MQYFVFIDELSTTKKEIFIRFDGLSVTEEVLTRENPMDFTPVVIEATLNAGDFAGLTKLDTKNKRSLRDKWFTLDVEDNTGYPARLYTSIVENIYTDVKVSNLEKITDRETLERLSFPF